MQEVHLGDRVVRRCVAISRNVPLYLRGTVVWIHPDLRYHRVRFQTPGGTLTECFQGVKRWEVAG